jgi:ubiquinone biosynthesis protein
MPSLINTVRDIDRLRQITQVLVKHGFGELIARTDLGALVPFRGKSAENGEAEKRKISFAERLRLALQDLGPSFVKLGQILSTRADLLPPAHVAELAKLQDAAPPVPADAILTMLVTELGRPIAEVFASFDREPLAAASIGQAHAATLRDGTDVVVKVRRPGVVEQVEEDLEILQELAAAASRRWELADQYDLVGLAQEFAQMLRAELDYVREGRSAERFAANFADEPGVHVPRVYWEATTARVLTLERVRGAKVTDQAALDAAGIDRRELAERAARIIAKMVFEDGYFHADPHPGNFFVEPGGRIGLIDFGMVGAVDERTQDRLVRLLLALTAQDPDRLVDAVLGLGVVRHRVDRDLLRRDLEHLIGRYYGQPLAEVALGPLLEEVLAIARRHRLQLPPNLALLLKTAVMSEGLGAQLDPSFRLTTVLVPYAQRLMLRRYSPTRWARRLGEAGLDAAQLGTELPRQVRRLLDELERGGLEVGMRPTEFEPLVQRLETLANRLVLGMLAAAFVVGLAVLMAVYHPPGWEEWAGLVFAVGFGVAGALGAYLAWRILRTGRG